MNDADDARPAQKDISERPSRARYDKVKSALDLKWRRRSPQAERMMREVVDALWDAFGGNPWTRCGVWTLQPDGAAFQPGPARPEPNRGSIPSEGIMAEALAEGRPAGGDGRLAVPVLDKDGKAWAVLEVVSPAPFDDMDKRWLERLLKAFQQAPRPERPLL
jgi:hypothetical protein